MPTVPLSLVWPKGGTDARGRHQRRSRFGQNAVLTWGQDGNSDEQKHSHGCLILDNWQEQQRIRTATLSILQKCAPARSVPHTRTVHLWYFTSIRDILSGGRDNTRFGTLDFAWCGVLDTFHCPKYWQISWNMFATPTCEGFVHGGTKFLTKLHQGAC